MKKRFFTVVFVFSLFHLSAQQGWERCSAEEFSNAILSMEGLIPEHDDYSYETEYTFYEDLASTVPVLTEKALLICGKGGEVYVEQFGKIIVQNNSINIEIDATLKNLVVRDVQHDLTKRRTLSDFSALQASGLGLQKKKMGEKTVFYIRFPEGSKYAGAELTTGGMMGLDKYVLYSDEQTFENAEGIRITAQPRMEVVFKNFTRGAAVKTDRMKKTADYLTLTNGEYRLTEAYKDFELIDLRSQQ